MRKFLPYILILTVILQIFAPFTIGGGVKNNLEIQTTKAEAADCDESERIEYNNVFNINSAGNLTESNISLTTQVTASENEIRAYFNLILDTGETDSVKVADAYKHTSEYVNEFRDEDFVVVVKEKENNKVTGFIDVNELVLVDSEGKSLIKNYPDGPTKSTTSGFLIETGANPEIFSPNKNYIITFYYQTDISGNGCGESVEGLSSKDDYIPIASTEITIGPVGTVIGSSQTSQGNQAIDPITNPLDCSWNNFKGCVAMVPYYLLFVPTSAVFSISGKIFDFAFGYSVQDTSYRSTFVVEGWGIVRDFCNMFFIFILLYIAIGTILNLHSVKTKEMIINVVIIGLLINFSLFATHVIIDASNILARVFYNSESIKITEKNPDGSVKVADSGEFIKMSEAIVSKVNPQELVLKAGTVGNIPDKGGMGEETGAGEISLATLVLVILLASIVNIVGTIVFISVALIFVGRVIGLWLAMILVPFTFLTYAIPSLQDLDMVGWKKWWPETVKMAFLAPVFIFFMYLIIKFLNLKLDLINTAGKSSMDFIVAILLPFAFIMILMWKAKGIAVKMSGTIGEMASKAGAAIGGVGLAVATGGAAMAMRGTLGRLGNKMATSSFAKDTWVGRNVTGKAGKYLGSKSYDVRATKLGGMAAKELGVEGSIGKAKEGGYAKHLSDKVERRQKRAKELEVSENEPLKQQLNREERALQELSARNSHPIEQLDKQIKGANDASAAAAALVRATDRDDPQYAARQAAAQEAAQRVIDLRTQRSNIKNGVGMAPDEHGNMVDQTHNTDNGLISTTAVDQAVADANRTQREATEAEGAVVTATANMATAVAAAVAAETAALNAATIAANAAIANATPENLAASATARTAAAAATANIATVRAASTADVARANAASAAARTAADTAGQTASNYMAEAQRTGTGRSMNDLEDHAIPDAHHAIDRVNRERKNNYARRKARWGGRANREAEHKIIMDTKIDTKEKH